MLHIHFGDYPAFIHRLGELVHNAISLLRITPNNINWYIPWGRGAERKNCLLESVCFMPFPGFGLCLYIKVILIYFNIVDSMYVFFALVFTYLLLLSKLMIDFFLSIKELCPIAHLKDSLI